MKKCYSIDCGTLDERVKTLIKKINKRIPSMTSFKVDENNVNVFFSVLGENDVRITLQKTDDLCHEIEYKTSEKEHQLLVNAIMGSDILDDVMYPESRTFTNLWNDNIVVGDGVNGYKFNRDTLNRLTYEELDKVYEMIEKFKPYQNDKNELIEKIINIDLEITSEMTWGQPISTFWSKLYLHGSEEGVIKWYPEYMKNESMDTLRYVYNTILSTKEQLEQKG